MLIRALLLCLLSWPALAAGIADNYLYYVVPDCATALAREVQICNALGCDGVVTRYLHPIDGLLDGTYAIRIMPGTFAERTYTLKNGHTFTLTAQEIAALQTRTQLAGKLPDVVPTATFIAEFTQAQITALNNVDAGQHPAIAAAWAALQALPAVDLLDAVIINDANGLVAGGYIPAAQAASMLTPAATVSCP